MTQEKSNTENKWQKIMDPGEESEPGEASRAEDEGLGIEAEPREKLEKELNVAEQKANEYKDQIVRLQAEIQNNQRRFERQLTETHKFATTKLLGDLVPVVDSLVHGLGIETGGNEHAEALKEGLRMTFEQFEKILSKHGVTIIDPKPSDAFNPTQHEAMAMVPHAEFQPNTIVQVLQKGYELNGRVIKAAMVVVAK